MARYSVTGTLVKINNGTGLINIDGVESVSGPTGEKTEVDTTSLADTANTSVPGKPDYGSVTLAVFDNPSDAGNAYLLTNFQAANTTTNFQIVLPFSGTGNTINFNGYARTWGMDLQKDAAGRLNVEIRVTGAMVRS